MGGQVAQKSDGQEQEVAGAGARSIAGYDYQVDVSIWLALDLVLRAQWASEVVIEPSTEEDLEADLAPHVPGRVTSGAILDGYKLVVQAKLRSGDAWSVDGIKKLLLHGVNRVSAAERLKDAKARYLLVTSAGLNGGAKGLRVLHAGNWPKPKDMPESIMKALPEGAAGRVGVIAVADEPRLESHIKTLLVESFRVPNARLDECKDALRQEANLRLRGVAGGRWTRTDLETLIRKYEGYIASSPELEHYVHPTNWGDLVAAIKQKSAALIIGQSGTGKTLATRKLYEELRASIPGLARVSITHGPGQLSADTTPPPVLYDIEDPWGRFDFDPRSRPWNDLLSRFFSDAKHDRMIVATSRFDVATSAKALETVKPWLVFLEAEHYGTRERRKLFQTRIDALPRELQTVARNAEAKVLSELATPLEIQKFFDAMPTIEENHRRNPAGYVAEAIRRAHQNSIERTVVDQINERDDVRAATVVWGLLKAAGKLSLPLVRAIEEKLVDLDDDFEEGVERLVAFFVAARNLRQTGTIVTYYHPRVEAGIEQALAEHRLLARRTFRDLIDALTSPDAEDQAWGVATSSRLMVALDGKPLLKPTPSPSAQILIDAYVEQELLKGGKAFEDNLDLAAAAGSNASNVSELARFLLHRPDRSFPGFKVWGAPEHDEAWYVRMRADANVRTVMDAFIRFVLPGVRSDYRDGFVAEAKRVAGDLTPAFLEAASRAVNYGVINSSDAIAEGALDDLAAFEAIVDAAVKVLTPSEEELRSNAETYLAIENGEYSEGYAEHLADNDDGYTASGFLEAYVERARRTVGWQTIAQHRHRYRLLSYWLRSLAKDETPLAEEVKAAVEAGWGSDHEDAMWAVLTKTWDASFEGKLRERLTKAEGSASARLGALTCLIKRLPGEVRAVAAELGAGSGERLIEMAIDLADLRHRRSRFDGEKHYEPADQAVAALPPAAHSISEAMSAIETKQVVSLTPEGRALMEGVLAPTPTIRVARLMIDAHVPLSFGDDIEWLLQNASERADAVLAMEAAIRRDKNEQIKAGLEHKYAHVVALALTSIAQPLPAPLPVDMLRLSEAKGSPVRKALVALLDAKPHEAHVPALVELAKDEWSGSAAYYGEAEDYPIAQAAIAALGKLDAIDKASAEELYRTSIATRDPDVRLAIFEILSKKVGGDFHKRLFELATNPGTASVRGGAAYALMISYATVSETILEQITAPVLVRLTHRVAARLLMLLAAAGKPEAIIEVSRILAANPRRRVLLLLAIWAIVETDNETAKQIARLLPDNHVGVAWALAGAKGKLAEDALNDLGDPESVEQVLLFMQPAKPKKSRFA